jgi:hypothetical protein
LQAFLASRPGACWVRHCYTIALNDGVTLLTWTDFDYPLVSGGTTYSPALLKLKRMTMRHTVEIPELAFGLFAADTLTVKGVNIKTAMHNGLFDGARVSLYRVWMKTPGDTSLGIVLMFNGRISQSQVVASGIDFSAKGDNVLMNQRAPRNLYQTTCVHTFCDSGCNAANALVNGTSTANYMVSSNFTESFSVGSSGLTSLFLPWASAPGDPALWTLGTVTFTSGVCRGQQRTITLANSNGLQLIYPLYGTPSPGDTFSALMGCSRTLYACKNHIDKSGNSVNNQQNNRSEPFIPQNELGV